MRRALSGLVAAAAVLLAGCESQIVSMSMSGTWAMDETSFDGIHNDLYLDQEGTQVTGIDLSGWFLAAEDTAAVSGTCSATRFNLHIVNSRYGTVNFVGQQVSNDELQGTWTWAPDSSLTVRFFRDP